MAMQLESCIFLYLSEVNDQQQDPHQDTGINACMHTTEAQAMPIVVKLLTAGALIPENHQNFQGCQLNQ